MAKLYRPSISLEVKARVLIRQRSYLWPVAELLGAHMEGLKNFVERQKLHLAATLHCAVEDLRLDHDPALGARQRKGEGKNTIYTPAANDPEFLIYREKHAHHIKTQVRGDGAQHPDRVLIKQERQRREGRRSKPKRKWARNKIQSRPFRRPKHETRK